MTVQHIRDNINWFQVIATAAAVLIPLVGYAISNEGRLSSMEAQMKQAYRIEERVDNLENRQERTEQWNEEVLRRLDTLVEMNRRLETRLDTLRAPR